MAIPVKDYDLENEEHRSLALEIFGALRGLRYGTVSITVHDGQVVQIDRHERLRLAGGSKTKPA
ncbi:MAG TPA: YezD family protein [bacterium]|nr:YezD family protein [bacterium]